MATAIVQRPAGLPQPESEFEDAGNQPSLPNSTSTAVAMVACNVILLVMLAACASGT